VTGNRGLIRLLFFIPYSRTPTLGGNSSTSEMATAFPPLSAAVTRILAVSGFPPQLKTRDIQGAFTEWETVNGGFKIKWIDDTNLLMVFADAGVGEQQLLAAAMTITDSVLQQSGRICKPSLPRTLSSHRLQPE